MPKKLSPKQIAFNTAPRPELDLRAQKTDIKTKPKGKSLFALVRWYISQEVLGTGKSEHTVIAVNQELQKFINYFYKKFPAGDYTDWTRQVTTAYIEALRGAKYSLNSMRRSLQYVKAFASYLNSIGKVNFESHPTRLVKPIKPKKPEEEDKPESLRILTQGGRVVEEGMPVFKRMKEAAIAMTIAPKKKPSALPYRDLAILTTLLYTGLRAHELCFLRIDQMRRTKDGGFRFSKIKRKGDPNFTGEVLLRSDGVPYLEEYIKRERDRLVNKNDTVEKYVFLRFSGAQMSRADIWDVIHDLALAALTPEMIDKGYQIEAHPHSLRHELTYQLLKTMNETETARNLGHKSTRYIARYSNRSKETNEAKLERLPKW